MIRTSFFAAATIAVGSLVAHPAYAETGIFSGEDQELAKAAVVAELQRNGISATSVDEWGGYVRAFVTLDDGHQVMRFFDPGSLAPVSLGGSAVATELSF